MRVLFLLLMCSTANASISCYTYGTITSCGDKVSIYKFDNMTQVVTPKGSATVYQYDTGSTIILPESSAPTSYREQSSDIPLTTPLQDLSGSD